MAKPDFTDPLVPLGRGKWKRASECSKEKLTEVVAFLEKNAATDRRGIEYTTVVLNGAKVQLGRK